MLKIERLEKKQRPGANSMRIFNAAEVQATLIKRYGFQFPALLFCSKLLMHGCFTFFGMRIIPAKGIVFAYFDKPFRKQPFKIHSVKLLVARKNNFRKIIIIRDGTVDYFNE